MCPQTLLSLNQRKSVMKHSTCRLCGCSRHWCPTETRWWSNVQPTQDIHATPSKAQGTTGRKVERIRAGRQKSGEVLFCGYDTAIAIYLSDTLPRLGRSENKKTWMWNRKCTWVGRLTGRRGRREGKGGGIRDTIYLCSEHRKIGKNQPNKKFMCQGLRKLPQAHQ